MDVKKFIKKVFLCSVPSVDIDTVKDGEIDCRNHSITEKEWDKILNEFCENENERVACSLWLVTSGPKLVI